VGFLLRLVISAFGLWLASRLLSGVSIDSDLTLFLAALLLGFVNAVVRPIAIVLTFPITLVTLGLFLWVVNAGMIALVARLLDGFAIADLGSALLAAAIVSVTGWVGNSFIGPTGKVEVLVVRRR
jgi:putative membrane protein